MWTVQTLYVGNLAAMQKQVENLSCRHDWVCYGEMEDVGGGEPRRRKSTVGKWDDVLGFVKRMAEEVGVVLVDR